MSVAALLMTLIVAIPSADGLAVCADRKARVWGSDGFDEAHRKLHALGPTASDVLIASAGATTFVDGDQVRFDADRAAQAHAGALHTPYDDAVVARWANKYILGPFTRARILATFSLPETIHQSSALFETHLYYFQNGQPMDTRIRLFSAPASAPSPALRVETLPIATIAASGMTAVLTEVASGHDARFDDLRANAEINRLWSVTKPIFTAHEAITLARRLILETSRRLPLLVDEPLAFVGPTADCAILGDDNKKANKKEIRWDLYQPAH